MCRFVLTFALGAGPVPSLLLPEIFPSRIRAKAMATCLSVHWVIFPTWLILIPMLCSCLRSEKMDLNHAIIYVIGALQVINFLVGLLFLRLLEQLGPQLLYSIFGTFCFMAVVFIKRNVVETKGRSLQEIEIALLPQE